MTTVNLSPYCRSVRTFFEDVDWNGSSVSIESNIPINLEVEEQSLDWRCSTLKDFFHDIDWANKQENFTKTYRTIYVVHPMALPVGHFFREFAQQASRKDST